MRTALVAYPFLAPSRHFAKTQHFGRFSNRPFGVKHFQTVHHHHSVDVSRGLVLLFGIGTKALPSWESKARWNNLTVGLTVRVTGVQATKRTHLIHRPARDIIPPLGGARVFSRYI
jgi:primosomal replication protein N